MLCLLGLSGTASNLRNQKIHAKWRILVLQEALEFRNLLSEHIGCVPHSTNDTEAAGVCDRCSEFGAGRHIHTSEKNGVIDFEKVGDRGTNLLCGVKLEKWLFNQRCGDAQTYVGKPS